MQKTRGINGSKWHQHSSVFAQSGTDRPQQDPPGHHRPKREQQMGRTAEADKERKRLQRRASNVALRRTGANAISPTQRWQKHSRALKAVLGPEPSKNAGKLDPTIKHRFWAGVIAEFSKWREGASPDKLYTGRNAAFKRAAALIASTPKSRQIQVLLRYWRLDNHTAWDAAGEQLKLKKNTGRQWSVHCEASAQAKGSRQRIGTTQTINCPKDWTA